MVTISSVSFAVFAPSYLRATAAKRRRADAAAAFASPSLTRNSCANMSWKILCACAFAASSTGDFSMASFLGVGCSTSAATASVAAFGAAAKAAGLGDATATANLGDGLESIAGGRRGDGLDGAGVGGADIGDVAKVGA